MDTLQETRCVHDSMNRPKIEFITYINILIVDTYDKIFILLK